MATAAQRALGVPELVENILIDVGVKTLLGKSSKNRDCCKKNSSISQVESPISSSRWYHEQEKKRAAPILGNPLARADITTASKLEQNSRKASVRTSERVQDYLKWTRPEASFRNMLVAEPAVKSVVVNFDTWLQIRGDEQHFKRGVLHVRASGDGVTIGDVFDALVGKQDKARGGEHVVGELLVDDAYDSWQWEDVQYEESDIEDD